MADCHASAKEKLKHFEESLIFEKDKESLRNIYIGSAVERRRDYPQSKRNINITIFLFLCIQTAPSSWNSEKQIYWLLYGLLCPVDCPLNKDVSWKENGEELPWPALSDHGGLIPCVIGVFILQLVLFSWKRFIWRNFVLNFMNKFAGISERCSA